MGRQPVSRRGLVMLVAGARARDPVARLTLRREADDIERLPAAHVRDRARVVDPDARVLREVLRSPAPKLDLLARDGVRRLSEIVDRPGELRGERARDAAGDERREVREARAEAADKITRLPSK